MVCPKCMVQMHQYKKKGAGSADVDYYDTAEVKECPQCKSQFVEAYVTFEIKDTFRENFDTINRLLDTLRKLFT